MQFQGRVWPARRTGITREDDLKGRLCTRPRSRQLAAALSMACVESRTGSLPGWFS